MECKVKRSGILPDDSAPQSSISFHFALQFFINCGTPTPDKPEPKRLYWQNFLLYRQEKYGVGTIGIGFEVAWTSPGGVPHERT